MNATIIALLGYISVATVLVVSIAVYRTILVMNKTQEVNNFKPDGSNTPGLGERLTRAYANCGESFVIVGGVMLTALASGASAITDPLALYVLAARIGQAVTHVLSTTVLAVQIRFAFFVAQVAICAYWLSLLFQRFLG